MNDTQNHQKLKEGSFIEIPRISKDDAILLFEARGKKTRVHVAGQRELLMYLIYTMLTEHKNKSSYVLGVITTTLYVIEKVTKKNVDTYIDKKFGDYFAEVLKKFSHTTLNQ